MTRDKIKAAIARAEAANRASSVERTGLLAEIARTDVPALVARVATLTEALKGWECPSCRGLGETRDPSASLYGDTSPFEKCESCEGTGQHPIARAALAAQKEGE